MKTKLSLIAVLVVAALPSFADECRTLTLSQAAAAKAIIEAQAQSREGTMDFGTPTTITVFCDSCKGDKPVQIEVASVQISTADFDRPMTTSQANVAVVDAAGKSQILDLAHAFLHIGRSETAVRLAPLVGCPYTLGTADSDILK